MKALLLLSALSLAAHPAQAQMRRSMPPTFDTQMVHAHPGAISSIDDLLADLRDTKDREKQIAALDQIAFAASRLTVDEQLLAVAGLHEAYDNPINEGGVRGRALDTIGKSAIYFKDQEAVRQAVTVLTEAAHVVSPADPRSSLRVYALLGLSRAAGHLLWTDERTEELVVLTALDSLRDSLSAQERLLSVMVVGNHLESRGAGAIYRNNSLTQRVDEQVLHPLEGGLEGFYADQKNNSEVRYFMLRTLIALARSPGIKSDWRWRVGQILRGMADRDPEARLRELARIYAGRIGR